MTNETGRKDLEEEVGSTSDNPTVLRISRHKENPSSAEALKSAVGSDVNIVTVDVRYGDDPVKAIRDQIKKLDLKNVVGVDAIAPPSVLSKLIDRNSGLGIPILKPEMERGEDGKTISIGTEESGRDILKIGHYLVMGRMNKETHRLEPGEIKIPDEGAIVVRIGFSYDDGNPSRFEAISKALGTENVKFVTKDVTYGNDPVRAVGDALDELDIENIVALDVKGPLPVLRELVHPKFGLSTPIIQPEMERKDGRAIVLPQKDPKTDREMLKIDHYSVIDGVEIETHKLARKDIAHLLKGFVGLEGEK